MLGVGLWESVRLRGCKEWFCEGVRLRGCKEWFCEGVRLSNPSQLGDCGNHHY